MGSDNAVSQHYARGDLLDKILDGVEKIGKTPDTVTIDDFAPVDDFHIGGRLASRDFLGQLSISPDDHVLDVGCGIGVASRFAAEEFGCRVIGVDLTGEYVETGTTLCDWLGLNSSVSLVQGNVLELEFPDATFDTAFMLHAGMNIPDKVALGPEISRVLKPGALFGIYDIMKCGEGEEGFPVPWATAQEESWLASPEEYKDALLEGGFEIIGERSRRRFAVDFLADLKAGTVAAGGPLPLGLPVIMGARSTNQDSKHGCSGCTGLYRAVRTHRSEAVKFVMRQLTPENLCSGRLMRHSRLLPEKRSSPQTPLNAGVRRRQKLLRIRVPAMYPGFGNR